MTSALIAACIAFALPSLFGWWPAEAALRRAVRERDEWAERWADRQAALGDLVGKVRELRDALNASLVDAAEANGLVNTAWGEQADLREQLVLVAGERDEAVRIYGQWVKGGDDLNELLMRAGGDMLRYQREAAILRTQLASVRAEQEARCDGWAKTLADMRAERDEASAKLARPKLRGGKRGQAA
jgi:hypothetical protein